MRDDDFLEWIGKNYYISPVIPIVIGSCFLVTYVAPLGPNVIQVLGYIDIFNFSLLAILFCFLIGIEFAVLYAILLFVRRLVFHRRPGRAVGMAIICGLAGAYVALGIVSYVLFPGFYAFYLDLTLMFFFMPLIYLILFMYQRDMRIILSLCFLTVYSLVAGATFGAIETATLDPRDEVCTDTCRTVDVFVVLSAYVVAFDAAGRTLLVKRDDVRTMTLHRDFAQP